MTNAEPENQKAEKSDRAPTLQPSNTSTFKRFLPWLQFGLILLGFGSLLVRLIVPPLASISLLTPLGLLLLWFAWRWTQPRALLVQTRVGSGLLAVGAVFALSTIFGYADRSDEQIVVMHWVLVATVLFLTIECLAAGWNPRLFTRAVITLVTLVIGYGLLQLIGWYTQWWGLRIPGAALVPVAYRLRFIGNISAHPNLIAMLINIALPLVLAELWTERRRNIQAGWLVWLAVATVVIFSTSSRGSWLATIAIVAITLIALAIPVLHSRQWRRLVTPIVLALFYAGLFVGLFLANLETVRASRIDLALNGGDQESVAATVQSMSNDEGRTGFWQRAVQAFKEYPITGLGPAGFDRRFLEYTPSATRVFRPTHAHSFYFTTLSELGTLGLIAISVLFVLLTLGYIQIWRKLPPADDGDPWSPSRIFVLGCALPLIGMLVHGLVDTPLPLAVGLLFATLATGLGSGGAWRYQEDQKAREPEGQPTEPQAIKAPDRQTFRLSSLHVPHVLHWLIVICALTGWGVYLVNSRRSDQWRSLQGQAISEARNGDYAAARQHAQRALALFPTRGEGYSSYAMVLAWQALDTPAVLAEALQATELAQQVDPTNYAAPINRAMLLISMNRAQDAEPILKDYVAHDETNWALPYAMLATIAEARGDTVTTKTNWGDAIAREPEMSAGRACRHSAICSALPLPPSAYAEIQKLRAEEQTKTSSTLLPRIEALADQWESVDLWSEGVLEARRRQDTQAEARFLAASDAQASLIGNGPTLGWASMRLQRALERDDQGEMRSLVRSWADPAARRFVPQITPLFASTTEEQFVQNATQAAQKLNDPALLKQLERYNALLAR